MKTQGVKLPIPSHKVCITDDKQVWRHESVHKSKWSEYNQVEGKQVQSQTGTGGSQSSYLFIFNGILTSLLCLFWIMYYLLLIK